MPSFLLGAWFGSTLAHAGLPDVDEPLRTGAKAPADAAVVVGIEDYLFLPDVPYARRDARAVYDFLVSTRGIPLDRVARVDGGSREQIASAVKHAADLAGSADGGTVWIYFAGHGVAAPSSGKRLLLGDDARQDPAAFEARGIPIDELTASARASGARVVVLVDACFNGASRSGDDVVSGTRFAVPAWKPEEPAGTLHWAASGPDQLARPLPAAEHGAFTYLALGALRGWADGEVDGTADGRVTAEEAELYLTRALPTVGIEDQAPELTVESPGKWVLSTATEPRPTLDPDAFADVGDKNDGPVPVVAAAPGLKFDPGLLATAQAYGVTLPLRELPFGLHKDAAGKRVDGMTYTRLVRSTAKGRHATNRLYGGIATTVVGFVGVMGTGVIALAREDASWAWGAAGSGAVTATGIGLLMSGQAGIIGSVQPLPYTPEP